MRAKLAKVVRSPWFTLGLGLILGALIVLGIRFATYQPEKVHYHANFAVFVNGKQEKFQGPQYYSEVEMCKANSAVTPTERGHMHDNIYNVVHVEDHAVTWGHFLTNLGWYLGPDFIQSPDGTIYRDDGVSRLHLMINGQDYTGLGSFANRVIEDTDRLLISYGDLTNSQLQQQYKSVPSNARKYDTAKDPASCGSNAGPTMRERMEHMF